MLTREAWNALLKILEEPPPGVVFVFATTEPQKIASTAAPVLSRLQRFDFRRIGPAAIRDRLRQVLAEEKLSAEEDALALIARYADGGMRDALSVLDQCLSFGEGPITAASVREVLGLIGDEQYAEVLRLVVDRDSGGVFPLVDGLVNAGADLAEFMNGTAELFRALLMVQNAAPPEGLTDTLRRAIDGAKESLQPADAVRMLSLLAEAETSIRRSASVRLVVETLLLRWTLMDRVVDLEQVIAGLAGGRTEDGRARKTGSPAPTRAPTPAPDLPSHTVLRSTSSRPPGELSLATLTAAWPEIVEAARARSILLGQALDATPPGFVTQGVIRLTAKPDQALLVEGVQRQIGVVEDLVQSHFGVRARITVAAAQPPETSRRNAPSASPTRPYAPRSWSGSGGSIPPSTRRPMS